MPRAPKMKRVAGSKCRVKASIVHAKGQQQQSIGAAASRRKCVLERQRRGTQRTATLHCQLQRGELIIQSFAECCRTLLLRRRGTVLATQAFGDDGTKAYQAFLDMVPARCQLAAGSGARRRRPERRVRRVFEQKTQTPRTRRYGLVRHVILG